MNLEEFQKKPNHLDIDADNDGITDNTEAQATGSYISPLNADADGDGLDNAYDPDFASGTSIVPLNTDMNGLPDHLDNDADNDGTLDKIEGHDTDGNGTADASSPANNGGTGICNADVDGDGLLDCYDNNTGSDDPTNGSLQPSNHPDVVDSGAEQDWRQGNCALCAMQYAIQDGNGTQTTVHKYDSSKGTLVSTSDTYGKIRTNAYCKIGDWRYYYNPANPTIALFAMKGTDNDLDKLDYIELTVGQNASDRQAGTNNDSYTRLMNRDWFVKMKEAQENPIDVRFYYPGSDYGTNGYAAANTTADGYNLTDSPTYVWFKIQNWDTYEPTLIEASGASIANAIGFTALSPTSNADLGTGLCLIDGTVGTDIGNGKNYVQFNGLTSFSGGTAGFGAGASQLPQEILPVELSNFEGRLKDCKVELSWSAESETNFSHYELERGFDGRHFSKIFSVAGSDDLSHKHYNYLDKSPIAKNYYRLKQVDLDGSFEYSKVIYISASDCLKENQGISIYPNPISVNGEMSVRFHAIEGRTRLLVLGGLGSRNVSAAASAAGTPETASRKPPPNRPCWITRPSRA